MIISKKRGHFVTVRYFEYRFHLARFELEMYICLKSTIAVHVVNINKFFI